MATFPIHSDVASHDPQEDEEVVSDGSIDRDAVDILVLLFILTAVLYIIWISSRAILSRCRHHRDQQSQDEPDSTEPLYYRL